MAAQITRPTTLGISSHSNQNMAPTHAAVAIGGNHTKAAKRTAAVPLSAEQRLAMAERRADEANQERILLLRQRDDLQTELRLAAQKQEKLKHSLDKAKGSNAKYAHLSSRLEELQRVHEESKASRDAKLRSARDQLAEAQRSSQQHAKARAAAEAHLAEVARERDEARLERSEALDRARVQHHQADGWRRKAEALEGDGARGARQRAEELQELHRRLDAAEERAEDAESQAELLRGQRDAVVHVSLVLGRELSEAKTTVEELGQDARALRLELAAWQAEAEERGSHLCECMHLVQQLVAERDGARYEAKQASADATRLLHELDAARADVGREGPHAVVVLAEGVDARQEADLLAARASADAASHAHRFAAEEVASLRAELAEVCLELTRASSSRRERHEALDRETSRAAAAERALEELRASRAGVERTRDAALREAAESRVTLERVRARVDAAEAEGKRQGEASRSLGAALAKARSKEAALEEQIDELREALQGASQYESAYAELYRQAQLLLSRSTQAESDREALSALNAELASHANPHQRIVYLSRVRAELAETRQDLLEARQERDELKERLDDAEAQLRILCSVEVPLGERPRAKVTRVGRAARLGQTMPASTTTTTTTTTTRAEARDGARGARAEGGGGDDHGDDVGGTAKPTTSNGGSVPAGSGGDDGGELTVEDLSPRRGAGGRAAGRTRR